MTVKDEETIEIVFTIDEARYLMEHFYKIGIAMSELQYKIYAKMRDACTQHEFGMTKKQEIISQIRDVIKANENLLDCDEYMLADMIQEIIKEAAWVFQTIEFVYFMLPIN